MKFLHPDKLTEAELVDKDMVESGGGEGKRRHRLFWAVTCAKSPYSGGKVAVVSQIYIHNELIIFWNLIL